MPIFEFKCQQCGAVTEAILKTDRERDSHKAKCPKCRAEMDPVPISKPAKFQWGKGGGWN
jgi:putative FmdB family regulatory protein